MSRALSIAVGDYPHTKALKSGAVGSDILSLDFASVSPISRAFAPMVRERRFDVCEMAIGTFLQAKAHGVDLTLLPIAVAARFQEAALLCRADSPMRGPADLKGKRVGVRAYSQTTGLWLRGTLAEDFGAAPADIAWVTFEGAHVAECADPGFVERAAPGKELLAMLRAGEVDAVIVGIDAPEDPAFRTLFADPAAAGERFVARHGFMPVNHLIVVKGEIARETPEIARELCRMFAAAKALAPRAAAGRDPEPMGRDALDASVVLAARWAFDQALLPRPITLEEAWRDSPEIGL